MKGMKPQLLITNISNELIAKASNIPRYITYLNTVNAKMILIIQYGMRFSLMYHLMPIVK